MDAKDILKKVRAGKYQELEPGTLIGLNICPECYSKLENKGGCKECSECDFVVC